MIGGENMSIYADGKRQQKSVRLTPHQVSKLNHICALFGIGYQRFLCDSIDYFYMEYLDVSSGRISINTAMQTSMIKLMDDYIRLKEIKRIAPIQYHKDIPRTFGTNPAKG